MFQDLINNSFHQYIIILYFTNRKISQAQSNDFPKALDELCIRAIEWSKMMLMNPVQQLYQTRMKTCTYDTQHAHMHPPNTSASILWMLFTRAQDTLFRQSVLGNGEANFKFSICKEVSWTFLQCSAPSHTHDLPFQACLRNGVYKDTSESSQHGKKHLAYLVVY